MSTLETLIQTDLQFTRPALPLDRKILEGVHILRTINEDDIFRLHQKVVGSFALMQADQTKEWGTCLALGIELDPTSEAIVDAVLFEATADHSNTLLIPEDDGNRTIWRGQAGAKRFIFSKHIGQTILDNGEMPESIVYSLLGRSAQLL